MYKSGTIVMAMVWGRALLIRSEIVCVPVVNAGSTSECQDLCYFFFICKLFTSPHATKQLPIYLYGTIAIEFIPSRNERI